MTQSQANPFLTIGTRGSPLALAQAELTRSLLAQTHTIPVNDIAIRVVSTAGDRSQKTNTPLSGIGGKGVFSKEIEELMLGGEIDLAVHSAKDMATTLPDGLTMPVFLEREDIRDCLIGSGISSVDDLPDGALIGTSSIRRRAQLLHYRPDLRMTEFRGNVGTRLKKLADGEVHATLLAAAGLKRLGMDEHTSICLDPDIFPPAPAQGAIGLECRDDDTRTQDLIAPLHHETTGRAVRAERAMLKVLDGSCRTPIGVLSTLEGTSQHLKGQLLGLDGRQAHTQSITGTTETPEQLGEELGHKLLDAAGPDFIAAMQG